MATTKIWPIKDSLKRVTEYAANPEKTEFDDLKASIGYAVNGEKTGFGDEKVYLTTGIRCNAAAAFEEMTAVKEAFGKTSGNVAYHAYQSFKPGEITPELCHQIGVELAEKLWGDQYQVLVATHLDKEHLHNHFIINSVSFTDGKKFNDNKAAYRKLRETSDALCTERGLSVIERPGGKTPRQIYFAEKNGEATKYSLMRWAIDEAVSMSTNTEMFEAVLRKKGYLIRADANRKYPVICSVYGGRPTRLYKLGKAYEPQKIYERICENDLSSRENYYRFMYGSGTRIQPKRIRINSPKPKQKIKGLFALYLHYLYLLGYRPKRNHYQPLTLEMKAAMRKCDEYSRQARLLAREHLSTEGDVKELIRQTDARITGLCDERQKIRNRMRRCQDPDQISMLRQKRDGLTAEIKTLRTDRKTAGQILDRAEQIREDVTREYAAREKDQRQKTKHREQETR
ncbi:MAG: relaxase/mobilization nuclease domain-containing protein [Erysipelotrichaceae bacterium]|nr:relaxase/mobilization nuclease domain-containing protein [Erysipelotrichaceae bacterium]